MLPLHSVGGCISHVDSEGCTSCPHTSLDDPRGGVQLAADAGVGAEVGALQVGLQVEGDRRHRPLDPGVVRGPGALGHWRGRAGAVWGAWLGGGSDPPLCKKRKKKGLEKDPKNGVSVHICF